MTRTSGDHMDLTDAFAARDRALRKVDEHADEAWKQQALEAVRRTAKQLPDYRFTPIIMLTTEAGAEMKERGKAAGVRAWIVKPFHTDGDTLAPFEMRAIP